jgi:hypothetical protein
MRECSHRTRPTLVRRRRGRGAAGKVHAGSRAQTPPLVRSLDRRDSDLSTHVTSLHYEIGTVGTDGKGETEYFYIVDIAGLGSRKTPFPWAMKKRRCVF